MKWFKNREDKEAGLGLYTDNIETQENTQICQANQTTGECVGVAKIRELQAELKNMNDYSPLGELGELLRDEEKDIINQIYAWTKAISTLLVSRDSFDDYINILQKHSENESKRLNLQQQIQEEKNKLGIE
jgi:putative IMPACT (imprinted ancient) family translation regulator